MGCPLHGGRTEKKEKNIFALRQWGFTSVGGRACCGECQEIQVPTGTECPGVRTYVFGYYWIKQRIPQVQKRAIFT